MYEYKVLDGAIITKKKQSFSQAFENLLNEMAKDGWEFYYQTSTKELIPQGCLFFASKPIEKYNQTFIFRREKKETTI